MIKYVLLDAKANKSIKKDTKNATRNISQRTASALLEGCNIIDFYLLEDETKRIRQLYFLLEKDMDFKQVILRTSLINGFVLYETDLSEKTVDQLKEIFKKDDPEDEDQVA